MIGVGIYRYNPESDAQPRTQQLQVPDSYRKTMVPLQAYRCIADSRDTAKDARSSSTPLASGRSGSVCAIAQVFARVKPPSVPIIRIVSNEYHATRQG